MELTARDLSYWHEELGDWYAPTGCYRICVGHASDEILLTADVTFSTEKHLPMVDSTATTFGELLNDPRTAPVIRQMMAQMGGGDPSMMENADPSQRAMLEGMMMGMPLKSMMTFGVMSTEQAEGLMDMLNGLLHGI